MLKANLTNIFKFFCLLGVSSLLPTEQALAVNYPYIVSVQGKASFTMDGAKEAPLKGHLVLRKKAVLKTTSGTEVKVLLDAQRFLVLRESSEIQLPVIQREQGQVPVLVLKRGEIYISQGKSYNMALRSELNEFITPPGRYILGFDPSKALSWVKVLEGTFEYSALNFEKSVTVKAGEQVSFQGVLEDGQVAYDVLLKGRKVARGQLTEITKLSAADLSLYAPEALKQAAEEAQKKRQIEVAKVSAQQAKFICKDPAAEFNQCMWVLEKTVCYRSRCNANGDWAEKTEVFSSSSSGVCVKALGNLKGKAAGKSAGKVVANPVVVAACDY